MIQRTQEQITQNWKIKENPLVSICCITYNHEKFISDALDGFLMQQTDFPFEILIHDMGRSVREGMEKTLTVIKLKGKHWKFKN